jgi:hypothetical protein
MPPREPGSRQVQPDPVIAAVSARCGLWLDWAATQIEISLAKDGAESDRLLLALDELLRAAAASSRPGAGESLEQKRSGVVLAMQSHDRVMQQLTHVAQSLRRLREHLADPVNASSADAWRLLAEGQMHGFSMPEERALFARMLDASGGHELGRFEEAGEVRAVDLFEETNRTRST